MLPTALRRSLTACRVWTVLNLKGVTAEEHQVDLRKGHQQHDPEFRATNPQGAIPALVPEWYRS
ncbi:MAG: glutathione S-transferase N-terminal domain-containing protein [Hyphomicrobiaceae bacterium]